MEINYQQVWQIYCRDITATFEHLNQCYAWTLKQCRTTVPEYFDYYKKTLSEKYYPKITQIRSFIVDVTPVGEERFLYQGLLDAYCWITICLLAGALSYALGGFFMAHMINPLRSLIAADFAIMFLAIYLSQSNFSEEQRGLYVLVWSVVDGLLLSSALHGYHLQIYGPSAIALTVSIAFATIYYNKSFGSGSRFAFIAATLAPGVIFELFFSIMFQDLGGAYLMWLSLLTSVACVDLQLKIGRLREGNTANAFDQICSIFLFNFVAYFGIFMNSGQKK